MLEDLKVSDNEKALVHQIIGPQKPEFGFVVVELSSFRRCDIFETHAKTNNTLRFQGAKTCWVLVSGLNTT